MNARRTTLLLLVVLASLWCAIARAQILSPGPLAGPHASLEGDDKCNRCHTSGKGVSNSLCTGCHGNIATSIAKGSGLHGRQYRGQACAKCHSDHRGRGFALIRWNPNSFDHGQAGWPLKGAHSSAKCSSCHKGGSYMGLGTGCTSCHKDPHANRFGSACTNCHTESAWKQVSLGKFNHDQTRFPLRGGHVKAPCGNCHGTPARYTGIDFGGCTSCHNDPHGGRFSKTCTNCHNENNWHNIAMKPGAHPRLSLSNGHSRVKCGACHDKGHFNRPTRGPSCASCHQQVHKADFGKRCEKCHASIRWVGLPAKIGLDVHDKTAFALRGRHGDVKCDGCHKPSVPLQQRYRQVAFGLCRDCHSDPHEREFSAQNQGECGPCHTEQGFRPTRFDIAAHAKTAFAIDGKHAAVPCGKCHSESGKVEAPPAVEEEPVEKGKKRKKAKTKEPTIAHVSTKRVRRLSWKITSSACANCHQNPHGDQFQDVMTKKGCAGCHVAAGWKTPRIDHKSWPLVGAHAHAACDRCHSPTPEDRKAGRGSSYKNTPRSCDGCHADVHAGQFRTAEPRRACNACHGNSSFRISRFDHQKMSGFELTGRHQSVACGGCHRIETLKSGAKVTRYRLGYRSCRQCHADPHGDDG